MANHQERNKRERRVQTFKLPIELIGRLGHYVVDRGVKERRSIEKSVIAEQAIDKFLEREGY